MKTKKGFHVIEQDEPILLREVRQFKVKRDLKDFGFVKGDIFEELFDKPNFIALDHIPEGRKKTLLFSLDGLEDYCPLIFEYVGTIPAEKSKYFDREGIKKLISKRKRNQKKLAKINHENADLEYFLNKI